MQVFGYVRAARSAAAEAQWNAELVDAEDTRALQEAYPDAAIGWRADFNEPPPVDGGSTERGRALASTMASLGLQSAHPAGGAAEVQNVKAGRREVLVRPDTTHHKARGFPGRAIDHGWFSSNIQI